jgi:amidase
MPDPAASLTRRTAAALAALVRTGAVSPRAVVQAHLERIRLLQPSVDAFQLVRAERALEEADQLARRTDLASLPLAGVPVAIKDNLDVAGEPTRSGSLATPDGPAAADHEVVRRVRAAGAIVVGKTRLPELGLWGTTDGAFGTAHNPWQLSRTAGGSSGGSAAAVAAGMVPIAVGNDGLGSIRIPAACCGLIGLKPGPDVVPAGIGRHSWFGMSENGPLATTVEDASLLFAVMAGLPPIPPVEPDRPLRIALSTRSPVAGVRVAGAWAAAARAAAELLAQAGHTVERADPPYPVRFVPALLGHWFAGAASDAEGLDPARLEPRARHHAALGRLAFRLGLAEPRHREGWRRAHEPLFRRFDLLLTPTLARAPIAADEWRRRSWIANVAANMTYAPFAAPWNFAGFPAAAVPAGLDPQGMPLSIQLVALPGGEALLLAVASQLERLSPWSRHPSL